jgi:hypothetical protein
MPRDGKNDEKLARVLRLHVLRLKALEVAPEVLDSVEMRFLGMGAQAAQAHRVTAFTEKLLQERVVFPGCLPYYITPCWIIRVSPPRAAWMLARRFQ